MNWEEFKERGQIEVEGECFSLIHLRDRKYSLVIGEQAGYAELSFVLLVQYSSHCVSYGQKHNEESITAHFFDHRNCPRSFCRHRYKLSQLLPDIFSNILNKKFYFTGHDNLLLIEIIDENGLKSDYEIFFRLYRETGRFLRLYVESAYIRTEGSLNQKPINFERDDKIRAKILFSKKLRKQPIRKPPSRR